MKTLSANHLFLLVLLPLSLTFSCKGKGASEETIKTNRSESSESALYVRKNAHSPAAKEDLEAMAIALEKMRDMGCEDPRSWYYQGAIHWIPDAIEGKNKFCDSYQTEKDLKTAWDNCTHASNNAASNYNFLIWHRFYILYFEQIVRELSGKKDFALPYWDYTKTSELEIYRKLPEAFQKKNGSLWTSGRLDSLNTNYRISGQPITDQLDIKKLMEQKTYFYFNNQINSAPHGAMHNYIGAGNKNHVMYNDIYQKTMEGGLMANVPSAGFDPIFWLHHANIDRLWQQWTDANPLHIANKEEVIKNQWSYVFFDAQGKLIQFSMKDVAEKMYDIDFLQYRYDDQRTIKNTMNLQAQLPAIDLTKLKKIKEEKPLRKINHLTPVFKETSKLKAGQNLLSLESVNTAKEIRLEVVTSFKSEPKNAYEIYLNLPDKENRNVRSKYFLGFLNFFGAQHHAEEGGDGGNGVMKKTFVFDITDELKLSKTINSEAEYNISIYLNGPIKEDGITIDSYTIYYK